MKCAFLRKRPEKRSGTSFFWAYAGPEARRCPRKEVLVQCRCEPGAVPSWAGSRCAVCFTEDTATAPSHRRVLGYVKSLRNKLYKVQLSTGASRGKLISAEERMYQVRTGHPAMPKRRFSLFRSYVSWKEQMKE